MAAVEADKPDVEIAVRWKGRGFRATVTGSAGDDVVLSDTLDLASADRRAGLIAKISEAMPAVDQADVEKRLLGLIAQRERQLTKDEQQKRANRTVAEVLVEIASTAELAHDDNRVGYARIEVNGHQETWGIRSQGFRQWLAGQLYDQHGKAASVDAMRSALDLVEAKAVHEGQRITAFVRVAELGGAIYLDLCDDAWRVVEVTGSGWKPLDRLPVWLWFRRAKGMLPLPVPVLGGSVDDLRSYLNLKDDSDFALIIAWLLAVLSPHGPFPILNICGEQGSAKSTMQRLLRSLVDPNVAPLRSEPKEPRDLLIAASNARIQAFDNLSTIPPWLSDAFCRLSTGGGLATRQLYTDDDEVIFDAVRPVMFNGITDLANRPDLLDRCITITLGPIPPAERKDEKTLWATFEEARARILGALLSAVVAGLAYREKVRIEPQSRPRMLDFGLWTCACEYGLPWKPGTFIEAYGANVKDANVVAIETSVVGQAILLLMDGQPSWIGPLKDLLASLEAVVDERITKRRDWPATERKLRVELDRIAPNLRGEGIDVQKLPRQRRGRMILLERITVEDVDAPGGHGDTPGPEPEPPVNEPPVRWSGRQPDLYEAPDGTTETFVEQAARFRREAARSETGR